MATLTAYIKRHPVLTYFALTFVISWGCVIGVLAPGGLPATLGLLMPAMLAGPSVSALLVTGLVDGRAGYRELWRRLSRWRIGLRWYAVAILTAPVLATTVYLALALVAPRFLPVIPKTAEQVSLAAVAIFAGLLVGFGEELGWTGFAIPRLRNRFGILLTGLAVGVAWGLWHFPLFWESDTFSAALPLALLLGRLFTHLPAYRVLMVWVYDRTGSLLVSMLMHASLTAYELAIQPATTAGADVLIYDLVFAGVLWIVAAGVALANGGRLSRSVRHTSLA